jgi:hypothetical protein
MPWETIRKSSQTSSVSPHLQDYNQTCATFSWETAR